MIIAYYKSIIVPCFKPFPLIHLYYFLEIFIQCILLIFTYLSGLLDPFLLFYLPNLEFSFFSYSEFICAAARLCLKDNIFFCLLLVLFCWYSCTNSVLTVIWPLLLQCSPNLEGRDWYIDVIFSHKFSAVSYSLHLGQLGVLYV